jgi:hypothetical protein
MKVCRSHWPRGLRHELSSPAQALGPWFRIPLEAWMFVYVYSVSVLPCVGSDLATGWSPVEGVLPTVYKIKKLKWNRNVSQMPSAPKGATGIWMSEWTNYFLYSGQSRAMWLSTRLFTNLYQLSIDLWSSGQCSQGLKEQWSDPEHYEFHQLYWVQKWAEHNALCFEISLKQDKNKIICVLITEGLSKPCVSNLCHYLVHVLHKV